MARTPRRGALPEEEEGAKWMDTYGDMVTLLLTFFVFLFSFSTIDVARWQKIVNAFTGDSFSVMPAIDFYAASEPPILSFGYRIEDEPAAPEEQAPELNEEDMRMFMALVASINAYIGNNDLQATVLSQPETKTIILRFSDRVLFASGSADVLPIFRYAMDHVITLLNEHMGMIGMIRIEGHTDNVPIHTAQFEDNWELSAKRATNVLRYFIDSQRLDMARISATGYGEFHPVESNDTVEGRAANRRVDFVLESLTTQ